MASMNYVLMNFIYVNNCVITDCQHYFVWNKVLTCSHRLLYVITNYKLEKNIDTTHISFRRYEYILLIFLFVKFCPYFLCFSDVGHQYNNATICQRDTVILGVVYSVSTQRIDLAVNNVKLSPEINRSDVTYKKSLKIQKG